MNSRMFVNVCTTWVYLYNPGSCFYLFMFASLCVCVYAYEFIISYTEFGGTITLATGEKKSQSSEGKNWEQYLLLTWQVEHSACTSPSILPVSESYLILLREKVFLSVRESPERTRKRRKGLCGVKRQLAGMLKWESNSKQNILSINKKLSLNNAARSLLTPLDLRFPSASSQPGGNWFGFTLCFANP